MIDDVLVFGVDTAEHDQHLQPVLRRLTSAGLTLNHSKCHFHQSSIHFLGHVIDQDGVRPDPFKVQALLDMPPCADPAAARWFLGMANHLGKFLPGLSTMSQLLRKLLIRDEPWSWSGEQQSAFDSIKAALTASPVLR